LLQPKGIFRSIPVDVYYKLATDLIDNGIFGQALVLRPRKPSKASPKK
jgi:hypothetical protein